MKNQANRQLLWLMITALIILSVFLGAHKLWTMENRWASISLHMLRTGDIWHPYNMGDAYFDKPILSYWPIVFLGYLNHGLNTTLLRVPSMLSGLLSVYLIFRLGRTLVNEKLGLTAAWILTSTFYFVFWARVASADMMTLAGILLAIVWYSEHRDTRFSSYLIFFIICAVTCLFKGLLGIALPILIILPFEIKAYHFAKHINLKALLSLIIATLIFCLPYIVAGSIHAKDFNESGFYLLYHENILRFFHPFDNFGHWYTYLKALPIYLLPWTFFFIPAFILGIFQYKKLPETIRWMFWASIIVFIFFNLSGSKRDYYILPILPYCILFTAYWINQLNSRLIFRIILSISLCLLLITYAIIMPWYYSGGGLTDFAKNVKRASTKQAPWDTWHFNMLNILTSTELYLKTAQAPRYYNLYLNNVSAQSFARQLPILKKKVPNNIYIISEKYLKEFKPLFKGYIIIQTPRNNGERYFNKHNEDAPVAFIPKE